VSTDECKTHARPTLKDPSGALFARAARLVELPGRKRLCSLRVFESSYRAAPDEGSACDAHG